MRKRTKRPQAVWPVIAITFVGAYLIGGMWMLGFLVAAHIPIHGNETSLLMAGAISGLLTGIYSSIHIYSKLKKETDVLTAHWTIEK